MMVEEFDKALQELQELCSSDSDVNERKFRLSALREKWKLQGLYNKQFVENCADSGENTADLAELDGVRRHLEPLGLAPEGTPLVELARLAALTIARAC
jgi:hypothetical protein